MKPDEKYAYARRFAVHVGVDTGKKFHVLVVRGPDGRRRTPIRVDVHRAGFERALAELRAELPHDAADAIVGLEFAGHHGFTFAEFLRRQGYTIVSVLPAHTKRTKETLDNSPLKTDEKDAGLICHLVGQGIFVPFPFLQSPFVELKLLVTHRHRLTVEETRYKNRLQTLLDLVWPEFMEHFCNLRKRTPLALLERWPTPADLLSVHPRTVERYARKVSRGQVGRDKVKSLLESAERSVGLGYAAEERRLELTYLFERWTLLRRQMRDVERRIEALVERCPEAKMLTTVPQVSAICAATIVTELGDPHSYESPRQVLKLAGMNLVGRSSGISLRGRRWQSKRGRPMLRRQLFLLAGRWCQPKGLYRADYERMLERNGNQRVKAVCAQARRLVPLLLHVMQSGEPFDLERWQANRIQREEAAV